MRRWCGLVGLSWIAGSLLIAQPAAAEEGGEGAKEQPRKENAAEKGEKDAKPKPPAPASTSRPDGVRLRGGFLVEGGGVLVPSGPTGGAASLVIPTLHLGVQINHILGVYYENHPLFALLVGASDITVGLMDLNTFVASATLLHTIELGGGGGFDVYALAGCGGDATSAGCGAGVEVLPGLHAKAAVHLGGWGGRDAHRTAFSLQAAFHASFDPSGGAILLPLFGFGGEWF